MRLLIRFFSSSHLHETPKQIVSHLISIGQIVSHLISIKQIVSHLISIEQIVSSLHEANIVGAMGNEFPRIPNYIINIKPFLGF